MAIIYPLNPTLGQQVAVEGVTYEWNGVAWMHVLTPGVTGIVTSTAPRITTSPTPPVSPLPNPCDLWFDNERGFFFIFLDDGTTQQWVVTNPGKGVIQGGPQGEQGIQGIPGPTGPAGPQGIQGVQGNNGIDGMPGSQGIPGPTGPVGPTGADSTVPGPPGPTPGQSNVSFVLAAPINLNIQNVFFPCLDTGVIGAAGQTWVILSEISVFHEDATGAHYFGSRLFDITHGQDVRIQDIAVPYGNYGGLGSMSRIMTFVSATRFLLEAKDYGGVTGHVNPGQTTLSAFRIA